MRIFLALAAAGLASAAIAYVPSPEDKLFAMTPGEFQLSAHSSDDSAVIVTIDTERGFNGRKGLMGAKPDDIYLRAIIDTASGTVRYQAVQSVNYRGGWRYFTDASFAGGGGPVTVIARDHACFSAAPNGCLLSERVAFDIPEATLRTLAASWRPRDRTVWPFRLKATANADFEGSVAPAEAGGLLRAVDAWKAKRKRR